MCLIIFVFNIYPLTELNKCVLNPSNRPVVYVIDVLQCGQHTNLADDSGKQTACFFCVVSDDKELVGELREQGLHSFPRLGEGHESGFPVLLVKPVRTFKPDVCRLEKIQLYLGPDVAPSRKNNIFLFYLSTLLFCPYSFSGVEGSGVSSSSFFLARYSGRERPA